MYSITKAEADTLEILSKYWENKFINELLFSKQLIVLSIMLPAGITVHLNNLVPLVIYLISKRFTFINNAVISVLGDTLLSTFYHLFH